MNIIHGKLLEQQLRLGPVRGFVCWVAAALEPAGKELGGCSVGSPIASQCVPALAPVKWNDTMHVPCSCHSLYLILSQMLDI